MASEFFEAHQALVVGAILSHVDCLDEQTARLSEGIEALHAYWHMFTTGETYRELDLVHR